MVNTRSMEARRSASPIAKAALTSSTVARKSIKAKPKQSGTVEAYEEREYAENDHNGAASDDDSSSKDLSNVPTPALQSKPLRMSYRIARGEQGVLTFEPYKSLLLPYWRFATPEAARKSSSTLWQYFLAFERAGDFVGMDMTRKFIQMGMTRARRYANHKGGRKYDPKTGKEKPRWTAEDEDPGGKRAMKEESARIFRGVYERCKARSRYGELRDEFVSEQKDWDVEHPEEDG